MNSFTVTSATQINANISIASTAIASAKDVAVTNASPGGGTATLTNGFTVDTSPPTSVENGFDLVPEEFFLYEAYPNPFNPSTKISFTVPENGQTVLRVYDGLSQVVRVLFDGIAEKGRMYLTEFDASALPTGIYLARLEFGGKQMIRKVVFVK